MGKTKLRQLCVSIPLAGSIPGSGPRTNDSWLGGGKGLSCRSSEGTRARITPCCCAASTAPPVFVPPTLSRWVEVGAFSVPHMTKYCTRRHAPFAVEDAMLAGTA